MQKEQMAKLVSSPRSCNLRVPAARQGRGKEVGGRMLLDRSSVEGIIAPSGNRRKIHRARNGQDKQYKLKD